VEKTIIAVAGAQMQGSYLLLPQRKIKKSHTKPKQPKSENQTQTNQLFYFDNILSLLSKNKELMSSIEARRHKSLHHSFASHSWMRKISST